MAWTWRNTENNTLKLWELKDDAFCINVLFSLSPRSFIQSLWSLYTDHNIQQQDGQLTCAGILTAALCPWSSGTQ